MKSKAKVVLVGGSGMVGRNILNHPLRSSWNFLYPTSKELNLSNFEATVQYLSSTKPDFVINAAGFVGGIKANISHPVDFLVKNIDIGRNIVLASKQVGIEKLLNLGASCMYPRSANNPLVEDMLLQGELEPTNEGYALAKIMTAKLCKYINSENPCFRYKTMIPCNIYGPFDNFEAERSHLLPAIIEKLHHAVKNREGDVEIWGDGEARREFMYAADLADAIIHSLVDFDRMPELLNIGVGRDFSINEYYSIVAKIVGYRGSFVHNLEKPVGMLRKLVSIEKQSSWGWMPRTQLSEGIKETYRYYVEELNH